MLRVALALLLSSSSGTVPLISYSVGSRFSTSSTVRPAYYGFQGAIRFIIPGTNHMKLPTALRSQYIKSLTIAE
ncbi:hypothetical protein OE88DRAFT_569914 [Heliocybe sulcata]|uniref:Uncharacterized protein n=1 Tax=Heliocybe sulcata TaxID=5364 RepID=A0A5C3MTL9_9AGAM|nr:hypothetical protein OE88DRAFT_569914 [Heliocybe sulcata]